MNRLYTLASVAFCVATTLAAAPVTTEVPKGDPDYIAKAMTAAPEAIAKQATFVRVDDNFEQTAVLQKGSNGFTCGIEPDTGIPFCADVGAMAWYKAIYTKADPPDRTGFVYMMTGDTGTSNHDPYATDKSHWVETGPHVMLVGKAARELAAAYPRALDPDPTQPYIMYPGIKYEHVMLPIAKEPSHSN
jgi:hypothetical protein